MRYDDEEPQHVLGIPVGRGDWPRSTDGVQQRVMGIPFAGFRPRRMDLRGLRHPRAYLAWRREVRKLGPYARSFAQVRNNEPPA